MLLIKGLLSFVFWYSCPNSDGDESRAPTLCLVCGDTLCSQSYCCQTELKGHIVGAVTAHTQKCGAGIGMFLRLVTEMYCLNVTVNNDIIAKLSS